MIKFDIIDRFTRNYKTVWVFVVFGLILTSFALMISAQFKVFWEDDGGYYKIFPDNEKVGSWECNENCDLIKGTSLGAIVTTFCFLVCFGVYAWHWHKMKPSKATVMPHILQPVKVTPKKSMGKTVTYWLSVFFALATIALQITTAVFITDQVEGNNRPRSAIGYDLTIAATIMICVGLIMVPDFIYRLLIWSKNYLEAVSESV